MNVVKKSAFEIANTIVDAPLSSSETAPSKVETVSAIFAVLLLIGLPLALGGKDPLSELLVRVVTLSCALLLLLTPTFQAVLNKLRAQFGLLLAALVCIIAVQLIPLPLWLLSLLSPKAAALYSATGATFGRISLDPFSTLNEALWLITLLITIAVGSSAIQTLRSLFSKFESLSVLQIYNPFALFFVAGGLLVTGIALAHWATGAEAYFGIFGLDRSMQSRRAHWPFVNPNHCSAYLQMALMISCGFFLEQCSSVKRRLNERLYRKRQASGKRVRSDVVLAFVFGASSFLIAVANLLTGSRMGNALMLIGVGVLVALHFRLDAQAQLVSVLPVIRKPLRPIQRRVVLAAATLAFLIAMLVITGQSGRQLAEERIAYGLATSFDDVRWLLFTASLEILVDYPLLGVGIGAWHIAAQGYAPDALAGFRLDYAHNDALQWVAETGLVGLLLLLFAFGRFARSVRSSFKSLQSGVEKRAFYACFLAFSLPLLHSLVDFPLHIPALAFSLAMLASVLLAINKPAPLMRQKL